MRDFAGKVAVVTGGASGIGRAMGARLAREGVKVALSDVEEPALRAAVGELASTGADVTGIPCDVTRFESVQELERRDARFRERVENVLQRRSPVPPAY